MLHNFAILGFCAHNARVFKKKNRRLSDSFLNCEVGLEDRVEPLIISVQKCYSATDGNLVYTGPRTSSKKQTVDDFEKVKSSRGSYVYIHTILDIIDEVRSYYLLLFYGIKKV